VLSKNVNSTWAKNRVSVEPVQKLVSCGPSKAPLGVMVVGAGDIARYYFEYCMQDERSRLVAVADPDPAARRRAEQQYTVEQVVEDYREVLRQNDIDVVIVCTPHYLHYPVVMDALRMGKNVICEKPIANTVAEADEMIDFAQACGKKLFVTLNSRFQKRTAKIYEVLSSGSLGKIFMARAAYLGYELTRMADPDHWKGDLEKAGGGVLLDGGYHVIDLMNSFLGAAKHVQALGGRFVITAPNKGEDNIFVLIEYECGAIADIQVSFTACNAGCYREATLMIDIDLYGTQGSLRYDYNWDTVQARERMELLYPEKGRQNVDLKGNAGLNCYRHFFDCLRNDTEPMVTALDARNTSAVVEAAYESMRTGKKTAVSWRP